MLNRLLVLSLLAGCMEDPSIDDELARLAAEHDGTWQLGAPLYVADDAAGPHTVALDREMIARKLAFDAAYRDRVRAEIGDEAHPIRPYVVIGTDDRTVVHAPRTYPYNKHVVIFLQRPNENLTERRATWYDCSGTFLDEDFVLTAAHCVYNRDDGHFAYANTDVSVRPSPLATQWGTDYGRGFACLGGDIDDISEFAANCEFVQARWVNSDWTTQTGNEIDTDYALIKLERANHASGMGMGAWMAMSALNAASDYESKTAVINGFPAQGPEGNIAIQNIWVSDPTISDPALRDANWELYSPVHLYHRYGDVDTATTQQHLEYNADSSGGDSGAAVFYYTDGGIDYTGQSHYIIGVHHGEIGALNGGTAVHEFRDWITTTMSAN